MDLLSLVFCGLHAFLLIYWLRDLYSPRSSGMFSVFMIIWNLTFFTWNGFVFFASVVRYIVK